MSWFQSYRKQEFIPPREAFYIRREKDISIQPDPLWYKDAVIYQLHVKAFFDSNNDGVGDFRGLRSKMDYLQGLGINTLWILPFYPSPLRDDGYDIGDYYNIHSQYGNLSDFKSFLRDAHSMGIRVICELVVNHTSDQHQWFQKARAARKGSSTRNFYVWSDSPDRYSDARIIFRDFENSNWSWDHQAKAYYWHRFYSHQPDLNFDNRKVQREITRVMDFWLGMGVDGLRLDAVPYLFEREGTNCENLPETHQFLKQLRDHVDRNYQDRMLLAEANQWPEDAVAYFGMGDECHMAFHFPIMPRIFMALRMEDSFPLTDILEQTPEIPPNCQWAMFLRNHDELTLEMVSDEERDYMYKVYARDTRARINVGIRRRLAPLLDNNRRKLELMHFLLFSLPGTPVLYYGDEIGMGDNYFLGDRDGVRTPMQWSPDRNAGFSKANPQTLYLPLITDPSFHYQVINVENQEGNPSSLLWWMRRSIAIRKRYKAFSRGDLSLVKSDNPRVVAFTRTLEDQVLLVVANLSRFSQVANLDLGEFQGSVPEELSSGNSFPQVSERGYTITLGPHGYFAFQMVFPRMRITVAGEEDYRNLQSSTSWRGFLSGSEKETLENKILPSYLMRSSWFPNKGKKIRRLSISNVIRLPLEGAFVHLCILKVHYLEGTSDTFFLPMSQANGEKEQEIAKEHPESVISELVLGDLKGILYDGSFDRSFHRFLYRFLSRKRKIRGKSCAIYSLPSRDLKKIREDDVPDSRVVESRQANTSVVYAENLVIKLFRKIEDGINPDVEMNSFLSQRTGFPNIPLYGGFVDLHREADHGHYTLAMIQGFCRNQGEMWDQTINSLESYFENVLAKQELPLPVPIRAGAVPWISGHTLTTEIKELVGEFFLELIQLLGIRTAEMHLALSEDQEDPAFSGEPFSRLYQRSLYQSMRAVARKSLLILKERIGEIPPELREDAALLLDKEDIILARLRRIASKKIPAMKIRIHGDFNLGQVLFTGKDFTVIDFEGETERGLSERKIKRSPLRDVAAMLRSMHNVVEAVMSRRIAFRHEELPVLLPWMDLWYYVIGSEYLGAYLERLKGDPLIPQTDEDMKILLECYVLEKGFYELFEALHKDRERIKGPIRSILSILEQA